MGLTVHFEVLNQLGTPMMYSSSLALRPAAGIEGRIFFRTDSPYGIYRDNGTSWDQIAGSGGGGITGSGTATQIAYFDAATNLTSTANLFWDNTNGRLGVNTATPGASIDAHGTGGTIIQSNSTTLGNSLLSYQLQGVGKWQTGNVYSAGSNYFRIFDQLNSIERLKIQNTGQIDTLGWITELNTLTGITGTSPSALTYNSITNNFTFNSGITTSASVLTIGLLTDNILNYSGANTINATSYNTSLLLRNNFTFGSTAASITYTQSTGIRVLANEQNQYIQNGANSGSISHYANIQILGDQKTGAGLTTFTNRYGLLINDFNEFTAGNTYTNRWGIYQSGLNESNFFAGKVGIGSGYSPSTYALDVNGTARVIGSTTFGTLGTGTGMFWDNDNNRFGIGTATPTKALDVSKDIQVNGWIIGKGDKVGHPALKNLRITDDFYSFDLLTTGTSNVFIGRNTALSITTGSNNVAIGYGSGQIIGSGSNNLVIGYLTGQRINSGYDNVVVGGGSLSQITSHYGNTAIGSGNANYTYPAYLNATPTLCTYIGYGIFCGITAPTNETVFANGGNTSGLGSNTILIGNSSVITTAIRGRLLLGTTTDSGLYQLDINGNARIVNKLNLGAGTTSNAQINLASSTAPTSPNDGDIWFDGTNLLMRIGGVTKTFTLI